MTDQYVGNDTRYGHGLLAFTQKKRHFLSNAKRRAV